MKKVRLAALTAVLSPWLVLHSAAHEDKDPVCGMMVEIEKAHGKETYAGQTFHFCGASCVSAFRADPEKFVSAIRVFEMRGDLAIVLTARPRVPKPGDLVRFYIQVGPPEKGGMIPDPKTIRPLKDGKAYVYRLDRSGAPSPEIRRIHPTEEPGTYGLSELIQAEGAYRVFFDVTPQTGPRITAALDCATRGATPPDDHHGAAPAPSPQDAVQHAPAKHVGGLTMAAQHDTMKRMGELWHEVGALLENPSRDSTKVAARHMAELDAWIANMPEFKLHKYESAKDEFLSLTVDFRKALDPLRSRIQKGDLLSARALHGEIEVNSCMKCHLKFRWGVASDLRRFPDLSGQP